ncbi:transporter substrate-binding domain-containing protein [Roseomonas stagni]|uniref:Transporter substrate-binding domain-containing protein n=1 Tax=Falsiroseomonas algicola TaxID=2716930 RepID=A0A6M1LI63_9PROT|nr:transporter substrate-binding domain-containing protein [Falsiroseomonas algicola]NGM19699.1 transporter substrate-binding domain-containing protein [Falsiroseomonas algicola]
MAARLAELRRLLAALLLLLAAIPAALAQDRVLQAGWYAGEPQQYMRQGELTGLDVEMVRAIARQAGEEVRFLPMGYLQLLDAVAAGRMDVATGIPETPERAARYALSLPYRRDVNVLIMRRGEASRVRAANPTELAAFLRAEPRFRLGVRAGFSYYDAGLDAFIASPPIPGLVRPANDDATNIRRLLAGEIDGFLAERLSVALDITRLGAAAAVEEAAMRIVIPLHLAFSRDTVPASMLGRFDAAIEMLTEDGTLDRIAARFRFPILLSLTIDSRWFLVLQITGTVASALAGALAARHSGWSLFGAFVLAGVTAAAGGVLRDLLMGRYPLGILRNPLFLQLIFGTVMTVWAVTHAWALLRGRAILAFWIAQVTVALRRRRADRWLFDFADALGLGASTVLGVTIAFGMGADPLWLWGPVLGTITGAGGGILRDVLRGGGSIPNLTTGFYGEVSVIWSLALTGYLMARGPGVEIDEVVPAVIIAVIGCVVTRMAALAFRWAPPRLA